MEQVSEIEKRYYTHSPKKVNKDENEAELVPSDDSEEDSPSESSSEDSDLYLANGDGSDYKVEIAESINEHRIRSKSLMTLSKKVRALLQHPFPNLEISPHF